MVPQLGAPHLIANDLDFGIASLVGIQNLTGLTTLDLGSDFLFDISSLSGLTSLTTLDLAVNPITDVGPLNGLTSLTQLNLNGNAGEAGKLPVADPASWAELAQLEKLQREFRKE